MTSDGFHGRLGVQQRVLPSYRAVFFEALARRCQGGLGLFAGAPLPDEGIEPADQLQITQLTKAKNRYFLTPNSSFFMCWQTGFIQWLEEWQPDVLIVEANPRYILTPKAIAWMHHRGRKAIGWGLGAPPISGPFSGLRQKERANLLQSLDAIVAYSQQGAEQYRRLDLPAEKVYVASNSVAPAPVTSPVLRSPQFEGPPTILFVGRMQSRKRLDLLLKACEDLKGSLQPRLVIIGDGPAAGELRQLAKNVYPSAEFVGAKHGPELNEYFDRADLFVLPGTGGLAIQQAMAHGLPVIVAQGDGTQDDLVRKENGWQVPPDNLAELTNVLRTALSDPAKLRRMGEASYQIVANEINVDRMVEQFILAVNQVHSA